MQDKNMPDEQEEKGYIEVLLGVDKSTMTLREYYDLLQKTIEKEVGEHGTVGDYMKKGALLGYALHSSGRTLDRSRPLLRAILMIAYGFDGLDGFAHGYNAYIRALGKKSLVDRCLTLYLHGKRKSFLKQFKGIVEDENQEEVIRELIGLDLDQRQEGIDEKLEEQFQPLLERVGAQYVEETLSDG